MLLLGNARLITWNDENPYIENGCVAINGAEIEDFGTTVALRAKYPDAEFYDSAGRIVMPGLINTHTHIYSAFARGLSLPQKRPNQNFNDILKNLWWRLDKQLNQQDNLYSAYSTGLESVRCGVTTVFDHHASQSHVQGSLFTIGQALAAIGLRSCLCYEVSERDGKDIAKQAIAENIAYIKHVASSDTEMQKAMFGLHASFTLSDEILQKCTAHAPAREAGYHIHCAEGIADLQDSLKKYGKRVVQRLYDANILGEKTLAVHNVHINAAEMDILRATKTMAVHNPESNMGNAVGCAPALHMMEKGVLLGLGTDAYTQDMFESLKVANLIHKHQLCSPSVGFMQSVDMLFKNNREICARFFKKPLGIVAKGAYADLAVVNYTPHTPLNAGNLAGHVVFGIMGRCVDSTIINGRFVMRERVMQTVDEPALLFAAQKQSAKLWARLGA